MLLQIAPNIASALGGHKPVVALESTVIAHGLPRPINLRTAHRLESIVSELGAVPATIGVMDGKLCVGLNDGQIRLLAEQETIEKVTTRDLPIAVALKWHGATTVASTCWIAHRAGIKVFATGGIGGVHRGSLPDISADLPELARTPIVVVCSGAKIVLDLAATREWLETHAVTVVGYQCDEMPAFYSRRSGLPIDTRVDSPADVVRIFRAQKALGIKSALLVTVPVPVEFEVPGEQLERVLKEALESAQQNKISGRELTPFLLTKMAQDSERSTLHANVALLENNARVAAEIANALATRN
jgi:pseudouridine-5'-phosphate glycosidase